MTAGPPLVLRDYQRRDIERLRAAFGGGRRAVLYQLPTGGGKTVVFSAIVASAAAKGKRALLLTHRRELIRQASSKLAWCGVEHGVIAPGFAASPDTAVHVGSVQTLAHRLDALPKFDLIVLDEAHHAVAGQWRALIAAQPEAKLLGVTATPARLDGKGLGVAAGGPFDDLVEGATVSELIAGGFLVPTRCFTPDRRIDVRGVAKVAGDFAHGELARATDRPSIIGDAVEHYRRHADGLPAIAFCCSVAHAQHVADAFRQAGYRAIAAHGGMRQDERDAAIAGLGDVGAQVLTSCDLVNEGLDVPAVGCVIALRPTASLTMHLQQLGRGMRPAPGKDALVVLDHAGNTLRHGMPEDAHKWTLDGVERVSQWDARPGRLTGFTPTENGPGRLPHVQDGDLLEMTDEGRARVRAMSFRDMARSRLPEWALRQFARDRGYRRGWVQHRLREQAAVARIAHPSTHDRTAP